VEKEKLFDEIRHYGTFTAQFVCTDISGVYFRVRTAEFDGKKYFIVQANGKILEILEI